LKFVFEQTAVLDYDTGLPTYACLTDGKKADVRAAKTMTFAKNY